VVIDVTERKAAEQAIHSLMRISEKLNSTLDVDTLLNSLIIEAMTLTEAEQGFAGLRHEKGMACRTRTISGDMQSVPLNLLWPPGVDWPGWVLVHKASYMSNDAQSDGCIVPENRERFGIRSGICTPIADSKGVIIGYFQVCNKKSGSGFTESDINKLVAMSRVASVAVQNALAYQRLAQTEESLRDLSGRLLHLQDEERRKIARELHDSTAQDIAALTTYLTLLKNSIPEDDPKRKHVLDGLSLAEKCTRDVRTLSYLLHPPLLEQGGLSAALPELAKGFSKRSGIRVVLDLPSKFDRLPAEAETALFRVVQESLNNIQRHSGSPTARIQLARRPDEVILQVKDQGRGMPPGILDRPTKASARLGVGLLGMRERLDQLGGRLDILSGDHYTTVRAILPFPGISRYEESTDTDRRRPRNAP